MVLDWNRDFLFFDRRAHLQPTLSWTPMVRPHNLYHLHRLMVSSRARHMHREIPPC